MVELPKIPKRTHTTKICTICARSFPTSSFAPCHSLFLSDNYYPFCNACLKELLRKAEFNWQFIDKLCQFGDIPFIPKEFERLHKINGDDVFPVYAKVFSTEEYNGIDWSYYFKQFVELREQNYINEEIPLVRDKKYQELQEKWGTNYSEEELLYLEDLFKGIMISQNVSGALQVDQAKKICKISLEIDNSIRTDSSGVEKLMAAYDRIVKSAEFTPKNTKNATDFDSIAELVLWLEKRGWVNQFYDNVTRDIVDETLQNIQSYNQRLYTNETSLGEEISQRISSLKNIQQIESYYDVQKDFDLEEYEVEAFRDEENEEFEVEAHD